MITIICGGRDMRDGQAAFKVLDTFQPCPTVIYSGGARGADAVGAAWGRSRGILVQVFPAQWELLGKVAGFRRNISMAQTAEQVIAFWDGVSKGTAHMIATAQHRGLPVYIFNYEGVPA